METPGNQQEVVSQPATPPPPLTQKKPNRTLFVAICIVILVAILGGSSYLLGSKNSNVSEEKRTQVSTPTVSEPSPVSNTIIEKIRTEIAKNRTLSQYIVSNPPASSLWWISEDNWNISVEKVSQVALNLPVSEKDLVSGKRPVDYPESKEFQALVAQVMIGNSYTLNKPNSSQSEKDDRFYDYIQAYENESEYCVAETNGDISSYENTGDKMVRLLRVTCATKTEFQKAYVEELPFLKALSLTDAIIGNIQMIRPDVALVQIHWRRTGAAAYLYKSGNEWKKIAEGQDIGPCKDLEKDKVPPQYWIDCTDDSGNIVKGPLLK